MESAVTDSNESRAAHTRAATAAYLLMRRCNIGCTSSQCAEAGQRLPAYKL